MASSTHPARRVRLASGLLPAGLLFLTAVLLTPPAEAQDLPFVRVRDPLAAENPLFPELPRAMPAPGETFRDDRLRASLCRLTINTRHEYARFDPFNADQSRVVLGASSGEVKVFRTDSLPCDRKENLITTLAVSEPRWDQRDPGILWALSSEHRTFQLLRIDVRTGKRTVVKDFARDPALGPVLAAEPDLYRITTKDEGEASRDLRFYALLVQGEKDDYRCRYLFTWDRAQDRVTGLYRLPAAEAAGLDWVGMSPLGTHVVIGADPGEHTLAGLVLADRELKRFQRIGDSIGHSDVGLDGDGKEVIVGQNNRTDMIDLIPLDFGTRPVSGPEDYARSSARPLVRLHYASDSPSGLQSGVHVSCNLAGYAVISTYIEPGLPERNWLDRGIILVPLDRRRPEAFLLAKIHNTTGAYWEETHATVSQDGSRLVWAANWGQNVGREKNFLMQLTMPAGWQARLAAAAR